MPLQKGGEVDVAVHSVGNSQSFPSLTLFSLFQLVFVVPRRHIVPRVSHRDEFPEGGFVVPAGVEEDGLWEENLEIVGRLVAALRLQLREHRVEQQEFVVHLM